MIPLKEYIGAESKKKKILLAVLETVFQTGKEKSFNDLEAREYMTALAELGLILREDDSSSGVEEARRRADVGESA
jgi:hypothetical protein